MNHPHPPLPNFESMRALVEEAGREIAKIFHSGDWTVTTKGDSSPLTQADLAANRILVEGLKKLSPLPIVSEESDPQSIKPSRAFWLIDPLDGTKEFVARHETFVICVGLIVDRFPVFGFIHAPLSSESWWAAKGQGAFGPTGQKLFRSDRRFPLIAAGSRSTPSEKLARLYKDFDIKEVQRYGSALKFCKLAEGSVDLYPRFGDTSEWDTAAGQIIAEESGCRVTSIRTGLRLEYGKSRYENGGGFVAHRSDLDIVGVLKARGYI